MILVTDEVAANEGPAPTNSTSAAANFANAGLRLNCTRPAVLACVGWLVVMVMVVLLEILMCSLMLRLIG